MDIRYRFLWIKIFSGFALFCFRNLLAFSVSLLIALWKPIFSPGSLEDTQVSSAAIIELIILTGRCQYQFITTFARIQVAEFWYKKDSNWSFGSCYCKLQQMFSTATCVVSCSCTRVFLQFSADIVWKLTIMCSEQTVSSCYHVMADPSVLRS